MCSSLSLIKEVLEDVNRSPVIFASLLDIVSKIRDERIVERRQLYLRTVLDTLTDLLHLNHPYREDIRTLCLPLAGLNKVNQDGN